MAERLIPEEDVKIALAFMQQQIELLEADLKRHRELHLQAADVIDSDHPLELTKIKRILRERGKEPDELRLPDPSGQS